VRSNARNAFPIVKNKSARVLQTIFWKFGQFEENFIKKFVKLDKKVCKLILKSM
jgi:hypothetical protein